MTRFVMILVGLATLLVAAAPPAAPDAARLAHYRAGEADLREGRFAEAEKALTAALDDMDETADFPEALLLRGLARERLGRQKEADLDFVLAGAVGRLRDFGAVAFAAGDKVTAVRRMPTFALGQDPNEPCCDLMVRADAEAPQFLEAGTVVEVVRAKADGWVEYKAARGQASRLIHAAALARPVAATETATVRAPDAGDALERSAAAFDILKVHVAYAEGESPYPVRMTVSAYGGRHAVLGVGVSPAWTSEFATAAEFEPVARRLADDHPFLTAQGATFTPDGDAAATVTTFVAYPRPHVIPVGTRGRHLLLSRAAQRDFEFWQSGESSTYAAKKFGLIIQEQHNNPGGHRRQLRGLETLLADNPWLVNDKAVAFLSEGTLKGVTHDLAPLTDAVRSPTESVIDRVFDTFLMTGYLAYEWKHRAGIPVLGYEDRDLYRISARLFTGEFADAAKARHLWWQAVIARNKTMADGLIDGLAVRECPILFMGGRHLGGLDASEAKPDWAGLAGVVPAADLAAVKKWPKRGVRDHLEEAGVGYTFLNVRTPLHDPYDYELSRAQYFDLFRAQEAGDLAPYFEKYTLDACPTVQPNPRAVARAAERAASKEVAEALKPVDRTLRQFGLLSSRNDFGRGLIYQELMGGGHTLLKHVNKTDEFLRGRLKNEGLDAASTFHNLHAASTATAAVIAANRSAIAAWLNTPGKTGAAFSSKLPAPVGRTLLKGSTESVPASSAVVVLRRDPSMPGGFRVHTAYPEK